MNSGVDVNIENALYFQEHVIPEEVMSLIPSSIARQYGLIPFRLEEENLYVAMEDPDNVVAIDHVARITGRKVIAYPANASIVTHHINKLYGNEPIERALEDFRRETRISESQSPWISSSSDAIASAPIVRLVDSLIMQAVDQRASDIHIEPMEDSMRIRLRLDGFLQRITSLPLAVHDPIISRIKVLGNMDIAEKRLPQDGRSQLQIPGKNIDIRISVMPTIYGEKCVLRLLDHDYFLFPKEALGFTHNNLIHFDRFLGLSRGIILITGPTGSGKSTTLYTMLNEINKETDNIITVEDPVECKIPGINQIQINSKAGMTFANSLRSVLRQDPDVIMIGEIRDNETAQIAIRAAITGHLVLSSVHTHDAIGAVRRLLDMGIENYLLSDSLIGVISQRLIRKACPHCKQAYTPDRMQLSTMGVTIKEDKKYYKKGGCVRCNFTGYKGRTAIHEVLTVDKGIRRLIQENATSDKIYHYARENEFQPLNHACIDLFEKGITTLEEMLRILHTFE
ncbi:MAG: type II/IV secretion system protein [Clostridiales bacterium]|jgi:type IV pilus assembly protein PilB|nr:type II/IV secretion system protein [Clostridiales bacterium]